MKFSLKEIAIIGAIAVIAVGLIHAFIRPMLPASVQPYIV